METSSNGDLEKEFEEYGDGPRPDEYYRKKQMEEDKSDGINMSDHFFNWAIQYYTRIVDSPERHIKILTNIKQTGILPEERDDFNIYGGAFAIYSNHHPEMCSPEEKMLYAGSLGRLRHSLASKGKRKGRGKIRE